MEKLPDGSVMLTAKEWVNIINWISQHLQPDDVFSQTDLKNWAVNNGYKMEE